MEALHDFLDNSPTAAAIFSPSGEINFANELMKLMFAISGDDDLSMFEKLLAKPDKFKDFLVKLGRTSKHNETIIPLISLCGRKLLCKVTATYPKKIDPTHFILWFEEQATRAKVGDEFKQVFHTNSKAQLIVTADDGQILLVNRAIESLIKPPEALGEKEQLSLYLGSETWKNFSDLLNQTKNVSDFPVQLQDRNKQNQNVTITARFINYDDIDCALLTLTPTATLDHQGLDNTLIQILDAASLPTMICDAQSGNIRFISNDLSYLLNVGAISSLDERKLAEFVGDVTSIDLLNQVATIGYLHEVNTLWTRSDGEQFNAKVLAHPFEGKEGPRILIILSIMDDKESLAYEGFFEKAPMPMLLTSSLDGQVMKLNKRAKELLDLSDLSSKSKVRLQEYIGKPHADYVLEQIKFHGFLGDFEAQLLTVYDEQIDCMLNGRQVLVDGQMMSLIYIFDFTQQKEAQETLKRFFEAAPMPMLSVRIEDHRILRLNKRASELFVSQYDLEESVTLLDQFFGEENTSNLINNLRARGFVDDLELNFHTLYGEPIWVLVSVQFMNLNGEDIALIGLNDITDRKMIEEALHDAKEEAEYATHQKSSFLSTMSHEIRTPMNGILGMLGLMQLMEMDTEQREALEIVTDSATSLLSIIGDILDFSKIEAGKLELENIDIEPGPLVENTLNTMSSKAREKGLELIADLSPELPSSIKGDPVRLGQILLNLISNAIKFTSVGAVIVRLSSQANSGLKSSQPCLRCEVVDQGIGITPEQQLQLFQPFNQADASTSRHFGGSGLGLSICQALIEMMDGKIGVESAYEKGATFWFEIPLMEGAIFAEEEASLSLDNSRILLIQRHKKMLAIMERELSSSGADVTPMLLDKYAAERVENLDLRIPFDAAIIDYENGSLNDDLDGCMLAESICELQAIKPEKIIITSLNNDIGISNLVKDKGYAKYLLKPASKAKYLDLLATTLERKQAIVERVANVRKVTAPGRDEALALGQLILLVDDNHVNRLVIGKQLSYLGFAFDTAENGLEALKKMNSNKYGLVLSDIRMPIMDGYELARRIRQREEQDEKSRLPLLALTANAMADEEDKCLSAGFDIYLVKPLKLQLLSENLDKWLPRSISEDDIETEQLTQDSANDDTDVDIVKLKEDSYQSDDADITLVEEKSKEHVGSETDAPINLAGFAEIIGTDDQEAIVEVLGIFVEILPGLVEAISSAVEAGDRVAINDTAHAAKGAARNAVALSLAALFEQLEYESKTLTDENLVHMMSEVQNETERVLKFIDNLR